MAFGGVIVEVIFFLVLTPVKS